MGQRTVDLEVTVRGGATRVHHALGNPLVVEVGDLLAEDEVLEERRSARARLERVLVVVDPRAVIGRQQLVGAAFAKRLQGLELVIGRIAVTGVVDAGLVMRDFAVGDSVALVVFRPPLAGQNAFSCGTVRGGFSSSLVADRARSARPDAARAIPSAPASRCRRRPPASGGTAAVRAGGGEAAAA